MVGLVGRRGSGVIWRGRLWMRGLRGWRVHIYLSNYSVEGLNKEIRLIRIVRHINQRIIE